MLTLHHHPQSAKPILPILCRQYTESVAVVPLSRKLYQVVAMANNLSQSSTSPNRELIYPIIQITHRVSLFPCRLVIVYQDRPYFLVVYRGLGGADNAGFISHRFAVAGHTRMLCRIWAGDWLCADAGSLSHPQATSARFVYGELTGQSPPWRFIIRYSIEYRR